MKRIKKWSLSIILIVITTMMGGCELMSDENTQETSSEKKIKQSFNQSLAMYPVKNLEDFYDKEGYRDEEFDKNDKGMWILSSRMAIKERKEDGLKVKGMVLRINRNTKMAEGEYFTKFFKENNKGRIQKHEKIYPVVLENKKLIPSKSVKDEKIRKEIENFRFFVQYANFKDLDDYGQGYFEYNPNVPSYSAKYQLSNEDYNVKQLREQYDIPTDKAPKMILKGVGEFKGSSVGYKRLEIEFEESKEKSIFFIDGVSYKPSRDE